MLLLRMKATNASRGMRRKRLPGTREPLSRPLSKQRMMVCWETLQMSAASPVVKTVFMVFPSLNSDGQLPPTDLSRLIHLSHLNIGRGFWQLECADRLHSRGDERPKKLSDDQR